MKENNIELEEIDRLRSIVVLSGGLDSAVCLAMAVRDTEVVKAITFDYGQRARDNEIEASAALAKHYNVAHQVIQLDWLKECVPEALSHQGDEQNWDESLEQVDHVWVPNRNGVFLNIAASFAEANDCQFVVFGANAEEGEAFPDNTPEYREALNDSLAYSTLNHVRVLAPVGGVNKLEILKTGLGLDLPYEFIWSCYEAGDKHCGVCPSCVRLKEALRQLAQEDQNALNSIPVSFL